MSLNRVSSILWRERELLELLVFKLEEEQLLLAAGRARWLSLATREIDMVLSEIKRCELGRAVELDAVAAELGLPAGVSLRELAERGPAPWDVILAEHRTALLGLSDEITALTRTSGELLGAGLRAVRDTLLSLRDQEPSTCTTSGQRVAASRGSVASCRPAA